MKKRNIERCNRSCELAKNEGIYGENKNLKDHSSINDKKVVNQFHVPKPVLEERKRLDERMKNIEEYVKKHGIVYDQYGICGICKQLIGSLFCDNIEQVEPPIKFNPLKCSTYRGTTNPISHVL